MIHISGKYRYLLYNADTDMRKSFHGLAAIVKYKMQHDVLIPLPGLPKSLVCGETRLQQSHCLVIKINFR